MVNKAEGDVFLELSCFFNDSADVGNLISGSSVFSKTSLNIWKFTVHILLKPGLENFEHYFISVWDEYSCAVVLAFFGILWDCNENGPFPVLWPLLSFPNLLSYWVQHFHASSFRIWNSSTGIPSPPLVLFIVMLCKAHLTSHSRMSGSRWVITPLWLSGSWRSFFVQFFCVSRTWQVLHQNSSYLFLRERYFPLVFIWMLRLGVGNTQTRVVWNPALQISHISLLITWPKAVG